MFEPTQYKTGNLLNQLRRCLCADTETVSHVGGALTQMSSFQILEGKEAPLSPAPSAVTPQNSPQIAAQLKRKHLKDLTFAVTYFASRRLSRLDVTRRRRQAGRPLTYGQLLTVSLMDISGSIGASRTWWKEREHQLSGALIRKVLIG